jgi:hypothetical protein
VGIGTPISNQTAGDCLENQCDGNGGIQSAVKDTDLPSAPECYVGVCTNGTPSTTVAAALTACVTGGEVCNGAGTCTYAYSVVRVGDGAGTLTNAGTASFIETRWIDGTTTNLPSSGLIALPTATSGSNLALTLTGNSTSEGGMTRSADKHYLALAGYNVYGTTTPGTTRVVGRIDATGVVDTATSLPSTVLPTNARSATTYDGSSFWVSGTTGGAWWIALHGTSGTNIMTTPSNARWVNIFNGQLYGTSGSSPYGGVFSIGSGLPTTAGQVATVLPGMTTNGVPYGFLLLDLSVTVAGLDTMFVADGSNLQRWTFDGATWTKDAAFTPTLGTGLAGLTGWGDGTGAVTLLVTNPGTIFRVDVTAAGAPTVTTLRTAGTNTAYRGVALAPQ